MPAHVGVEDAVPFVVRDVEERGARVDPRVVHEDVDAVTQLRCRLDQRVDVVDVAYVDGLRAGLGAVLLGDLGGDLVGEVAVEVGDHHGGTRFREPRRRGPADPACGAGDDGRAALQ